MLTFGVLCLCSWLRLLVFLFLILVIWSLFRRFQVYRSTRPCYPRFLCFLSTHFRVPAWFFAALGIILIVFCIFPGSRIFTGSFGSSCHRLGFAFIRTLWPCWSIYSAPRASGSRSKMPLRRSIPVLLESSRFSVFSCMFSTIWFFSHSQVSVFQGFFHIWIARLEYPPSCSKVLCFYFLPSSLKSWSHSQASSCTVLNYLPIPHTCLCNSSPATASQPALASASVPPASSSALPLALTYRYSWSDSAVPWQRYSNSQS